MTDAQFLLSVLQQRHECMFAALSQLGAGDTVKHQISIVSTNQRSEFIVSTNQRSVFIVSTNQRSVLPALSAVLCLISVEAAAAVSTSRSLPLL